MNKYTKNLEEAEWITVGYDRSDSKACDPCKIWVNEFVQPQCKDCNALFTWREPNIIKQFLQERFGPDWAEEYELLLRTRDLVDRGDFRELQVALYDYLGEDWVIGNQRYFYEAKGRN